jgi:hypothetical protein
MPNTSKKSIKKGLASLSSLLAVAHVLLKVSALDLMSFQDRGMMLVSVMQLRLS